MTRICVCGLGNPASIRSRRNQVSLGECPPRPSIRGAISNEAVHEPSDIARPADRTSAAFTSAARASASRCMTAASRGKCLARSKAVRCGVVRRSPLRSTIVALRSAPAHDDASRCASACARSSGSVRAVSDPECTVERSGCPARDHGCASRPRAGPDCVEVKRRCELLLCIARRETSRDSSTSARRGSAHRLPGNHCR